MHRLASFRSEESAKKCCLGKYPFGIPKLIRNWPNDAIPDDSEWPSGAVLRAIRTNHRHFVQGEKVSCYSVSTLSHWLGKVSFTHGSRRHRSSACWCTGWQGEQPESRHTLSQLVDGRAPRSHETKDGGQKVWFAAREDTLCAASGGFVSC